MTPQRQFQFWGLGLVLVVLLLWAFRPILLPFVAGMAIAYLLDPLADRLERWGAGRTLATALIIGGALIVLVAAIAVIVPVLQTQLTDFARQLPAYVDALSDLVQGALAELTTLVGEADMARIKAAVGAYAGTVAQWVARAAGGLVSGTAAFLNLLSLLFITPVVAFYLLRDWDRLVAHVDGLLPRHHAADIRRVVVEIDRRLSGFVRGQVIVAAILGVFYAVALSLAGLDLALIVGLGAGALSIIPFVGSIGGFVVAVGMALIQFDSLVPVAVVAVIFVAGQAAESNILTPRLVGNRVGLHPVWVMFALLAGGALLGIAGMLLAIPAAAVIAVLVEYGGERYRASALFHGGDRPPPAAGPDTP